MADVATAVKIATLYGSIVSAIKPLKSMLTPASLVSLRECTARVGIFSVLSIFSP